MAHFSRSLLLGPSSCYSYHPGPCEWFGLNCLSLASRPLCQTQASAPRCLWGRRGAGPVRPSVRPSERCQAPEGSVSTLTARVGHGCAWQKTEELGMPGSPCARGLEQALMPAASCPAGEGGQAGREGGALLLGETQWGAWRFRGAGGSGTRWRWLQAFCSTWRVVQVERGGCNFWHGLRRSGEGMSRPRVPPETRQGFSSPRLLTFRTG